MRNHMYNIGLKPAIDFTVPTIVIGNLNVGGSGKTPMTELLIRGLKGDFRLAVLSRGYGRKTKGFLFADDDVTPTSLGDEPYQLYRKFKNDVVVAVGEERAMAIPYILAEDEGIKLILLDDAYQHRAVKGTFNILLTDFAKPFYDDMLLPAGRLRESAGGACRADAIIITKVPHLPSVHEKKAVLGKIVEYAPKVPVFFSGIEYGVPEAIDGQKLKAKAIILVTGIANAVPLKNFLTDRYKIVKHFRFPDHHLYTKEDVMALAEFSKSENAAQAVPILTTEKDFVKLTQPELLAHFDQVPLYYQPMAMFIHDQDEEKLLKMIKAAIHKKGLN